MAFDDDVFPPDDLCEICGARLDDEIVIQEFADGSLARLCNECAAGATLGTEQHVGHDPIEATPERPSAADTDPLERTRELLTPVVDLIGLQREMQGALERLAASLETFAAGVLTENLDKTATVEDRVHSLERELETTRARLREAEALMGAAAGEAADAGEGAAAAAATDEAAATGAETPAQTAGILGDNAGLAAATGAIADLGAAAGEAADAGEAAAAGEGAAADEAAAADMVSPESETSPAAEAMDTNGPAETADSIWPSEEAPVEDVPAEDMPAAAPVDMPIPPVPESEWAPVPPPAEEGESLAADGGPTETPAPGETTAGPPPVPAESSMEGFRIEEVQAAQRYFNESPFTSKTRDVQVSLGRPRANLTRAAGPESRAFVTVAWDIVWYQYLVDMRLDVPSDERVVLHREGMDLDELAHQFKEKNATIDDSGRLDASELEIKLLSDPTTLITEMTPAAERALEDATEEIWDQHSAPEFKWDD